MKNSAKALVLGMMGAVLLPVAAQAQWWAQHPGYLHALSDLRTASWLIQHRGASDPVQSAAENQALHEIHAAYHELEIASISDGKNLGDQPPPNFPWGDRRGQLHQAQDLLHKAHEELRGEEENPAARDMRTRAIYHVEAASSALSTAIQSWHY